MEKLLYRLESILVQFKARELDIVFAEVELIWIEDYAIPRTSVDVVDG